MNITALIKKSPRKIAGTWEEQSLENIQTDNKISCKKE
jgi:hypothetical protein